MYGLEKIIKDIPVRIKKQWYPKKPIMGNPMQRTAIEQMIMIIIVETPVPDFTIPYTTIFTVNKIIEMNTPAKNETKNL